MQRHPTAPEEHVVLAPGPMDETLHDWFILLQQNLPAGYTPGLSVGLDDALWTTVFNVGQNAGVLEVHKEDVMQTSRPHVGAVKTMLYSDDPTFAVGYSAHGLLFTGSADRTIKVWDPRTGACERTLMQELHPKSVTSLCVGGDPMTPKFDVMTV